MCSVTTATDDGIVLGGHVYELNALDDKDQTLKDLIHQRLNDPQRSCVDEDTGCWIYTGSWDQRGNAKIRVGQRSYTVTKVTAWLYVPGFELWDERMVIHTCDYPACYNPDHVEVHPSRKAGLARLRELGRFGSQAGRSAKTRPGRRLNLEKARYVRQRLAAGDPAGALATELGVRPYAIKMIDSGLTWPEPKEGSRRACA